MLYYVDCMEANIQEKESCDTMTGEMAMIFLFFTKDNYDHLHCHWKGKHTVTSGLVDMDRT